MSMVEPLTPDQRALVQENYPLAKYLARIAWNKNREALDLDEIVSVAFEGLIGAARRFDTNNGANFSSFARTRINGAILDWQRTEDHVSRTTRADFKRLREVGLNSDGTGPSIEDLAKRAQMPIERARLVLDAVAMAPLSIDGLLWDGNADEEDVNDSRLNLGDENASRVTMGADRTMQAEEAAIVTALTSHVVATIRALPPLQQTIVALRYYSGYDLQVISTQLSVSIGVVRSAHTEAVMAIHAAMRATVDH
jgi:RNA polymerase sigma factor for flagellar operon FliA